MSDISPDQRVQWWLATLDEYDNASLTDGPHDDEASAHRALYLIQRMGLPSSNGRFAVARVELFEAIPDSAGANEAALDRVAEMVKRAGS